MDATTTPDPPIEARFLLRWLAAAATDVEREADRLTELDSPIGDADHGVNLRRGFLTARTALEKEPPGTPGGVLVTLGRQLISTVGGASGPLYGTLLRSAGKALGDAARVTPEQLGEALRVGVDGVGRLGGATPGDKTMIDALAPAVEALSFALDSGADLAAALSAAALAADEGAAATVPLQARKGRASYLGERSIGHQDPGATSSALLVAALARTAGKSPEAGEGGR
jgi:phosphoenolpyruvate---glycerone phosphotransferase subunit DhaL